MFSTKHYKKYYNNETLNVINTKFKKDFELLDYKKYDNIDDFTST